jgi:hypothetical protein
MLAIGIVRMDYRAKSNEGDMIVAFFPIGTGIAALCEDNLELDSELKLDSTLNLSVLGNLTLKSGQTCP